MRNLTLESLAEFEAEEMIATGVVTEPQLAASPIRWVAIKGRANDWAVYYHFENMGIEHATTQGEKVIDANLIQNLVPCDREVLNRYRL